MAETTLEIVRRRLANGTLSDGDVEELILEIERLTAENGELRRRMEEIANG